MSSLALAMASGAVAGMCGTIDEGESLSCLLQRMNGSA
jgi:hypothetical protein